MSKTSKQIGLKLPIELLEKVSVSVSQENLCEFIRMAFIEKLNRDFGYSIDPHQYSGGRGSRFDMKTAQGRLKAEKNLAKARSKIVKRGKKAASKLALAFGKAQTPAESRSLASQAVKPRKTI